MHLVHGPGGLRIQLSCLLVPMVTDCVSRFGERSMCGVPVPGSGKSLLPGNIYGILHTLARD